MHVFLEFYGFCDVDCIDFELSLISFYSACLHRISMQGRTARTTDFQLPARMVAKVLSRTIVALERVMRGNFEYRSLHDALHT